MNPQRQFNANNEWCSSPLLNRDWALPACLPFTLIEGHLATGAPDNVIPNYQPLKIGIYAVGPPGQNPSLKIRVLTDLLIDCFRRHRENGGAKGRSGQRP
jgi:DNA-binding transcriptional LysR family regulator